MGRGGRSPLPVHTPRKEEEEAVRKHTVRLAGGTRPHTYGTGPHRPVWYRTVRARPSAGGGFSASGWEGWWSRRPHRAALCGASNHARPAPLAGIAELAIVCCYRTCV